MENKLKFPKNIKLAAQNHFPGAVVTLYRQCSKSGFYFYI